MTTKLKTLVRTNLEPRIVTIRGLKVILDADLANIYGAPTKQLNEQIKRNPACFHEDIMFQLTAPEYAILTSQFAMSKPGN